MQGKMAVIGDYDSILAFKAGGLDVFGVDNAKDAKDTIKKIAKDYQIILLTDNYAKENAEYLKRFLEEPYPIILTIPSKDGDSGYAMDMIKEEMERALGVDILFRKNERGDK